MPSKDSWKKWFAKRVQPLARLAAPVATLMAVLALMYGTSRIPEMHDTWLRAKVGSRVYFVQDAPGSGGGTGFAVKGKTGQTYTITNDHICKHAKDGRLWVTDQGGRSLWRRVIERSESSDLCIVEAMPGDEGLELGSRPAYGEQAYVIGHPRLRPLTLSKGEINGSMDLEIWDHVIESPEDKCDMAKNKIIDVDLYKYLFGIEGPLDAHVKVCANVTTGAYLSNIIIFPGNSGSPVVDYWGNVEGVAFASDDTNWAMIVSLYDVQQTLLKY